MLIDDGKPRLQLQTLTGLWLFARHLYSVGEFKLWVPISHNLIKWAVIIGVPMWALLHLLRVPPVKFGLTVYALSLVLPTWAALRAVSRGESPRELVLSWLRMTWHLARRRTARTRTARLHTRASTPLNASPARARSVQAHPATVTFRSRITQKGTP